MKRPIQIFNYSIRNSASDAVDIHIDGEIVDASTQAMIEAWFGDTTSTSYKSFRNAIDKHETAKVFNVYINCIGGHVGDAMAMHDFLVDLQNKGKIVNTKGIGIIASSGTLILLAGANPEMSENSYFMMHTVSGGIYGTVKQVENYATTMRKFNDSIRDLYAKKTGMRKEEVSKLMDNETWMTATEAKEKGFITNITGSVAFQNVIEKEQWDFANTEILNKYNGDVKPPETSILNDMKKLFTNLTVDLMNAIKGIKVENNVIDAHAFAEAIGKPINDIAEKIDNELPKEIGNFFNTEAGKKVVADMVSASLVAHLATEEGKKPVTDTIAAQVEAANKKLADQVGAIETQLENKIGNGSIVNKDEKAPPAPVGSFS